MKSYTNWTILGAGLLAFACAAQAPNAHHGGEPEPNGDGTAPSGDEKAPNAFPEGGGETSATSATDAAPEPAAPPAPDAESAPPTPASPSTRGRLPKSSERRESASADTSSGRAAPEAKKSSRPLELEPERPGLGTNWGETMTSRVSNAPFERATKNPFSLTTIAYNDQQGIAAMLRGASLVDFRTDSATSVANGVLSVRLVDENGSPLPTFTSGARNVAQGEIGERYMIEIANSSANRFEAVVTVDGLDVIDGKSGSIAKRGYLVQPFATLAIDGFRQSMDEVAAFRFGSVRGSYAARKGNDRNVGVIGVAFFAERGARQPWTERELVRRETADPFPGRFAEPPIAR